MRSRTTKQFRAAFQNLPGNVKRQARSAYRLFKQDPHYPGLNFKPLETIPDNWSVRISLHYRAVGVRSGDGIVWYWIGFHSDYDKLLSRR